MKTRILSFRFCMTLRKLLTGRKAKITKAEEDLIIAEQNQNREIILKAIEKEKCELLGIIQGKDKAIKNLEWQLKQVTEDNDYYQAENERLEKENTDLKAQIEKMKCCGNCNHFDFSEPNYCHKGVYRERQYVCSKWEFVN